MHKALFFALLAACAVNVACLCGHLSSAAGPTTSAATASPLWIASSWSLSSGRATSRGPDASSQ
jgi:hypothetical protein